MSASLAAALLLALVAIPPLTDGQRERIALAHDDRDHQEEAFVALRENVASWTAAAAADAPQPDLEIMVEQPGVFRGRLYRLEGVIQQVEPLPPPHEGATAWFLRDDVGRPILVYVCGLEPAAAFRAGQRVTLPARFYKRLTMTARDGEERAYAAFVGARPQIVSRATGEASLIWLIIVPVGVMLIVFIVVLLWARRHPRPRAGHRVPTPPPDELGPPEPPLPSDAADALAEMRRRARIGGQELR